MELSRELALVHRPYLPLCDESSCKGIFYSLHFSEEKSDFPSQVIYFHPAITSCFDLSYHWKDFTMRADLIDGSFTLDRQLMKGMNLISSPIEFREI